MNDNILPLSFYNNRAVTEIAKSLLGCVVHTRINGHQTSAMIVETEAYRGLDDKGCHAYRHGLTPKTRSMFLTGGCVYVYLCYGVHPMLNLVVNEKGTGDAVLIRAVEPIEGMEIMEQRRGPSTSKIALTNGPGKLTVALGIDMEMDGCVLEPSNHIMRLTKLQDVSADEIYCGPRVGMSKYVAECSHWPWRFYIKDNKWVSKPLIAKYPHW